MHIARPIIIGCFLASSLSMAEEADDSQCAASREVEAAFDAVDELRDIPYTQRTSQGREILEAALKKNPDDIWLHRRRVIFIRSEFADEWPALRQSYLDAHEASQDDAARAYLAGWALVLDGFNTPKGVEYLERAKRLDPGLSFPYLTLTTGYSRGPLEDRAKAEENIVAYFRACPGSSDSYAHSMLARIAPAEAQREVAAALRQRLEASSDPEQLRRFEDLWSLEFRSTPPTEHRALRKRIAKDLARLEALSAEPDADWLAMLITGYKQAKAERAVIARVEDRLLAEHSQSRQAGRLFLERDRKEYPSPGKGASEEERARWNAAAISRRGAWLERSGPDSLILQMLLINYMSAESVSPTRSTP